jgi:hypothetical protein
MRNAALAASEPETLAPVLDGTPEQVDHEASRTARAAWARLTKKECEADPLICPYCGREMRFLSVIQEPLVVEGILCDLGLSEPRPPSQAPPEVGDWPVNGQIPLTYEPLPAIA